jgi:16S rRNA G966 N2-methylase RsmD
LAWARCPGFFLAPQFARGALFPVDVTRLPRKADAIKAAHAAYQLSIFDVRRGRMIRYFRVRPIDGARLANESVDLIYLDPPFNSNASYNVLFKSVRRLRAAE